MKTVDNIKINSAGQLMVFLEWVIYSGFYKEEELVSMGVVLSGE